MGLFNSGRRCDRGGREKECSVKILRSQETGLTRIARSWNLTGLLQILAKSGRGNRKFRPVMGRQGFFGFPNCGQSRERERRKKWSWKRSPGATQALGKGGTLRKLFKFRRDCRSPEKSPCSIVGPGPLGERVNLDSFGVRHSPRSSLAVTLAQGEAAPSKGREIGYSLVKGQYTLPSPLHLLSGGAGRAGGKPLQSGGRELRAGGYKPESVTRERSVSESV